MRSQWFLLLVALASQATCDPNAPCYYPTGNLASGFYPCDPTAYITMCCPEGYTCFSNSLCVATLPDGTYPNLVQGTALRGACTNPLWNDAICGDECLEGANADGDLVACGNDRFCCAGDYDDGDCDCSSDGDSFYVEAGLAQTIIGVSWTTFTGSPSYLVTATSSSPESSQVSSSAVTSTSSDISTTSASAETTTPSTIPSSTAPTTTAAAETQSSSDPGPSNTSDGSSTTTPSSTSSTTSSATGTSSSSAADGEPSIGVKAGLGVGIPFLVAGVVGLSYFLYRRRKDRLAAQHAAEPEQEAYVGDMRENDHSYPRYSDPHAFDAGHSVPNIPPASQGPFQEYQQSYQQAGTNPDLDSGPPPASPWERQTRFGRR